MLQHRIMQSRLSCWNTFVPTLITPVSLQDVGDLSLSLPQFYLERQGLWPSLHRRQKLCSFHLYCAAHFQKAHFSSLGTKWAGISAQAAHGLAKATSGQFVLHMWNLLAAASVTVRNFCLLYELTICKTLICDNLIFPVDFENERIWFVLIKLYPFLSLGI